MDTQLDQEQYHSRYAIKHHTRLIGSDAQDGWT
jgi:hypothetical protein